MQPPLPLPFQRLPPDVRLRLELAEAAAVEALLDTHAEQALHLVVILAPRMAFDEAVGRYIEIMGLSGDEAEIVHTRALVALSERDIATDLARERHRTGWGLDWRYATPLGAIRFVRRRLRRSAEEDLWMELAAARAEEALIHTHVQHALHFVDIMGEYTPPPRGVSLYLDQLEVPTGRARAVYQRALAHIAEVELPRLTGAEPYPAHEAPGGRSGRNLPRAPRDRNALPGRGGA